MPLTFYAVIEMSDRPPPRAREMYAGPLSEELDVCIPADGGQHALAPQHAIAKKCGKFETANMGNIPEDMA